MADRNFNDLTLKTHPIGQLPPLSCTFEPSLLLDATARVEPLPGLECGAGFGTTVCPSSRDSFDIVTNYIKLVTTSWTDGRIKEPALLVYILSYMIRFKLFLHLIHYSCLESWPIAHTEKYP